MCKRAIYYETLNFPNFFHDSSLLTLYKGGYIWYNCLLLKFKKECASKELNRNGKRSANYYRYAFPQCEQRIGLLTANNNKEEINATN